MHVQTSTPVHRPARLPFAAAVVVMFASVIGVAQAVEFDEKVKAPQAKGVEQLRLTAQVASQQFPAVTIESREAAIRDKNVSRRQFDARWTLVQAVETGKPIGDLREFGLVPSDDGSIHIDLKKYPQWDSFESRVVGMLTRLQMDGLGEEFVNRGMKASDVAALAKYIASNDATAMSRRAGLPVTLGFAQVVRKYDKSKRAVPNELVFDYFYQSELATLESNRLWIAGLLDVLEPQGRRVLLSYFNELEPKGVWGPSDYEAGIRVTLANFRLPDFDQRARDEALGGAK